jgi:hypothetical protein
MINLFDEGFLLLVQKYEKKYDARRFERLFLSNKRKLNRSKNSHLKNPPVCVCVQTRIELKALNNLFHNLQYAYFRHIRVLTHRFE